MIAGPTSWRGREKNGPETSSPGRRSLQDRLNIGVNFLGEHLVGILLLRRQAVQTGGFVFLPGLRQILQHWLGGRGEEESGLLFAAFRVLPLLCPKQTLSGGFLQRQGKCTAGKSRKIRQIPA